MSSSIEPNCCTTTLQIWNPTNENSIWRKTPCKIFGLIVGCIAIIGIIIGIGIGETVISDLHDFETGYKKQYLDVCKTDSNGTKCIDNACRKYLCHSNDIFGCILNGFLNTFVIFMCILILWVLVFCIKGLIKWTLERFGINLPEFNLTTYYNQLPSPNYKVLLIALILYPACFFSRILLTRLSGYDINTGYPIENVDICTNANVTNRNICYYDEHCQVNKCKLGWSNISDSCYFTGTGIFTLMALLFFSFISGIIYMVQCTKKNYDRSFEETKKAIIKDVTGYEVTDGTIDEEHVELDDEYPSSSDSGSNDSVIKISDFN